MRLSPDAAKVLDHLHRHRVPDLSSPNEVWTTPFGRFHRECFFRPVRDPRVSSQAALRFGLHPKSPGAYRFNRLSYPSRWRRSPFQTVIQPGHC
jgi:hypothetical protein